jgi:heptosyltransferase-1
MRFLVVKMSSLGDIIQTWPALSMAKQLVPALQVDWALESEYVDLMQAHPLVEQVIAVPFRTWRKKSWFSSIQRGELQASWRKLKADIAASEYDAVIDFQGLMKSAIVCRLAQGKPAIRHGWQASASREALAALFYDRRHKGLHYKAQHAVLRYMSLMADVLQDFQISASQLQIAIDYGLDMKALADSHHPRSNLLEASDDVKRAIIDHQAARSDMSPARAGVVWLLHGSARVEKCWDEASWIRFGRALSERGYRCAIAWGSIEEHQRARRMVEAIPHAWMPSSRPDYSTWMRLFARAQLAVGVDSGLLFLAAACQLPSLGLYVATSPDHVGVMAKTPHKNLEGALTADLVFEEALALLHSRP